MSRTRTLATAVVLSTLTAAGVLAACGAEQVAAKDRIRDAFNSLKDEQALAFTLSIEGGGERLRELAEAEDADITAGELDMIETAGGGELQFGIDAGEGAVVTAPAEDAAGYFRVVAGGGPLFEIGYAEHSMFTRIDPDRLVDVGVPETSFDDAEAMLADLPPELSFVGDFLDGRWLSVDSRQFQQVEQRFKDMAAEAGAEVPTEDESMTDQARQVLSGVTGALREFVDRDVVVSDAGEDDELGDRLRVTAPLDKLATILVDAVADVAPIPVDETAEIPEALAGRKGTVDLFVKDGTLTGMSVDVSQFADPEDDIPEIRVRLEIDSGDLEAIEVPGDAVVLDLNALFESFMGFASQDSTGWSPAPEEMIEQQTEVGVPAEY